MNTNKNDLNKNKVNHAPGTGSDKQHPDTPADANERSQTGKDKGVQKDPGSQNTG